MVYSWAFLEAFCSYLFIFSVLLVSPLIGLNLVPLAEAVPLIMSVEIRTGRAKVQRPYNIVFAESLQILCLHNMFHSFLLRIEICNRCMHMYHVECLPSGCLSSLLRRDQSSERVYL